MTSRPPLQLNNFFIEECSFKANVSAEDSAKLLADLGGGKTALLSAAALDITIQLGRKVDDELGYRCRLTVATKPKIEGAPCSFSVSAVGIFQLTPELRAAHEKKGEDSLGMFLSNQLPSIVYGSLRDFILTITSKGPYQGLLLPSFFFQPTKVNFSQGKAVAAIAPKAKDAE